VLLHNFVDVRMQQPVKVALLKAPRGNARFGVHAHVPRNVAPGGKENITVMSIRLG